MSYYAQPIPLPANLYIAKERKDSNYRQLGWDQIQPPTAVLPTIVDGNHNTMLSEPNVSTLGKILLDHLDRNSKDLSTSKLAHSPLVPLQSERNQTSRLVCVPGAGAGVTSFFELANSLTEEWSVFGLQPRGVDGLQVPHSTVDAAAITYIEAIEQTLSPKPPHLLGHSFGGWVVFEMAQRLTRAGNHVASLTILDSQHPDESGTEQREYEHIDILMEWVGACELMTGKAMNIRKEDFEARAYVGQIDLLHLGLIAIGLMPKRSDPKLLQGPLRTFARALRTNFVPRDVYTGPVNLVLVDDPKISPSKNRLKHESTIWHWRRWAPNLTHHYLDGNHFSILKTPFATNLVTLLERLR